MIGVKTMPDIINVDQDMRHMLDQVKAHYNVDDSHLIRSLLRNELASMKDRRILERHP